MWLEIGCGEFKMIQQFKTVCNFLKYLNTGHVTQQSHF